MKAITSSEEVCRNDAAMAAQERIHSIAPAEGQEGCSGANYAKPCVLRPQFSQDSRAGAEPPAVLLVGLGRGLPPAMQHQPPPKPQCFAAAGRAGFEELRKPSANLGLRLGLAALALGIRWVKATFF